MIELRLPGYNTTFETRAESYETVDKKKRYNFRLYKVIFF